MAIESVGRLGKYSQRSPTQFVCQDMAYIVNDVMRLLAAAVGKLSHRRSGIKEPQGTAGRQELSFCSA